jgi:hypothetical protein
MVSRRAHARRSTTWLASVTARLDLVVLPVRPGISRYTAHSRSCLTMPSVLAPVAIAMPPCDVTSAPTPIRALDWIQLDSVNGNPLAPRAGSYSAFTHTIHDGPTFSQLSSADERYRRADQDYSADCGK